jgi:hypothetical protein
VTLNAKFRLCNEIKIRTNKKKFTYFEPQGGYPEILVNYFTRLKYYFNYALEMAARRNPGSREIRRP